MRTQQAVGLGVLFCGALLAAPACSGATSSPKGSTPDAGSDAAADALTETSADTGADIQIEVGSDGAVGCGCSPGLHNQSIIVVSDQAELLSYDPAKNTFAKIADLNCAGEKNPYSLAVDRTGTAWVLFAGTNDIMTLDVTAPAGCADPTYLPNQNGFGLFGMAFSTETDPQLCERIYAHSYSGNGPFTEGKAVGALGRMDPSSKVVTKLADIDFNGGELAGTGDGRLFAFAGDQPAKLIEYDKNSGAALSVTPLTGLSKTTASAFAHFGGDFYFFTEATPAACAPCLSTTCSAEVAQCQADSSCAAELSCALGQFMISDDCGGLMPAAMQSCVNACAAECLPAKLNRKSQVHRLDFDGSDDAGGGLSVASPSAPVRIVGADSSTCVQFVPR
ncbi:MAG TPA: hypothetical protein PKD61_22760 [Polyangiaceae bacterium]|nr:hypothetical protein [Polyangiaceae bacterium]